MISKHITTRLLLTVALSSILCTGFALAEAKDEITVHARVVEPGDEITISWQTTYAGANFIYIISEQTNRVIHVINRMATNQKVEAGKVYTEKWSTSIPGDYRLQLKHQIDATTPAECEVRVRTKGRPSLKLKDNKGTYKTYEPIRLEWIVPKDFVGSLKLVRGSNTYDSVASLAIDPKDGTPNTNKFDTFYTGITSLTTNETGAFSFVLVDDRVESNRIIIPVTVGHGQHNAFKVSIVNKQEKYRVGDSLKVKWTAPANFQGYILLGDQTKQISGTSGETEFQLDKPGQFEVSIGYPKKALAKSDRLSVVNP